MSKAGKEKFTDPGQKEVKKLLNERFGEAVFYSTSAPAKSTQRYLDELRQTMSNRDAFDRTLRLFEPLGRLDFDCFQRCLQELDGNRKALHRVIDAVSDIAGDREPCVRETKAAAVLHDHIQNVEKALTRMEKKPFDRDLHWLYPEEPDTDTLKRRMAWLRKRTDEEFERLKASRYPMPFLEGQELKAFVHAETQRFGKLFEPDHYESEWKVLHDYPAFGEPIDLAELYITCQDLINNQEATIISSAYRGRWTLLAMAKGIKAYLSYLDEQLYEENNKEETATVRVPDPEPLDDRIHLHPNVLAYVQSCFSLLKLDESGLNFSEPIMPVGDVDHLLQSNFADTGRPKKRKKFKANTTDKGYLTYFFGQVLRRIIITPKIPSEGFEVKQIIRFVQVNFPDYREDKPDSVGKSLRRKPVNFPHRMQRALNEKYEELKAELDLKT